MTSGDRLGGGIGHPEFIAVQHGALPFGHRKYTKQRCGDYSQYQDIWLNSRTVGGIKNELSEERARMPILRTSHFFCPVHWRLPDKLNS